MGAVVLPDSDDFELNPQAEQTIEAERRALNARPADVNEATQGPRIETESELDKLTARDAARQARAAEKEQQSQPQEPQQPVDAATSEDADLPPEYRGKSAAQIAREYKAFHSQIGRNGHELGALRQYVANLERQHATTASKEEPAVDPVELLADPKAAIHRAVTQHPAMQSLRQAAAETLARKSKAEFEAEFPDHAETVASPEFRSWVDSSKVRREMIRRAHLEFDTDAARHLFSAWAARRAPRSAAPSGEAPNAQAAKGATPAASKSAKVYRRADIQKLMIENPSKYEAMADAIAAAYASGRVI